MIYGLLIVAVILYLWCGVNLIGVSRFTVASAKLPRSFDGFKILQLSDLHSKTFGRGNGWLIDKIDQIRPDIIVASGDMMNSKNDDGHVFERLAAVLVKKYPVYFIPGNHERGSLHDNNRYVYPELKEKLSQMGVHILEDAMLEITRTADSIRLYGLSLPLRYYHRGASTLKDDRFIFTAKLIEKRLGRADHDKLNLLLVHSPYFFDSYAQWGADLSFAGHVHGGAVRVPFLGGLLSPDRTFFTRYDAGLFRQGDAHMIVSRGLGTTHMPLRVLNQPEVVCVTLRKTPG